MPSKTHRSVSNFKKNLPRNTKPRSKLPCFMHYGDGQRSNIGTITDKTLKDIQFGSQKFRVIPTDFDLISQKKAPRIKKQQKKMRLFKSKEEEKKFEDHLKKTYFGNFKDK